MVAFAGKPVVLLSARFGGNFLGQIMLAAPTRAAAGVNPAGDPWGAPHPTAILVRMGKLRRIEHRDGVIGDES
jgi:hypothetical protein